MRSALAAAAAAAFAIAAVGCASGSSKQPPATPANRAEMRPAVDPNDVLAYLPIDAELVFGMDLVAFRQSPMFGTIQPIVTKALGTRLDTARQCGIDPLQRVERFTIAGKLDAGESFAGVLVVRGVDGQRVLDCVATAAKSDPTVRVQGNTILITGDDKHKFVGTIVGSSIVFEVGATVTRDTLSNVLAAGSPLRRSPAFMTLFDRREPSATAWMMVNGAAPFMAELRQSGVSPKSIDGTLTFTDRVSVAMRFAFSSQDEADRLVAMAGQITATATQLIERFEVTATGTLVTVNAAATEAQLRTLASMLGALVP